MTEFLAPREKLIAFGARSLSDVELLAIFLRTGMPGVPVIVFAQQLIDHFGSLNPLLLAPFSAFSDLKGIGVAKYAQIHAVVELARRFYHSRIEEEKPLLSPADVREFLHSHLAHEEREVFMVLFLDNQHRVMGYSRMFSGTLTHVEVHPREIVREAMRRNAAALILSHNHPSGRAEPSRADRDITTRIVDCCHMMDIRVLDHLVVGRGESVSFAERGWI